MRGYEHHATSRFNNRKLDASWILSARLGGRLRRSGRGEDEPGQSTRTTQGLDARKDLEVAKDDIQEIELKKLGTPRGGQIPTTTK